MSVIAKSVQFHLKLDEFCSKIWSNIARRTPKWGKQKWLIKNNFFGVKQWPFGNNMFQQNVVCKIRVCVDNY